MKAWKCLRVRAVPQQIWLTIGIALALALVYGIKKPALVQAAQAAAPPDASAWKPGHTIVNPPVRFDHSAPLPQLLAAYHPPPPRQRRRRGRRPSTTAPVAKPAEAPPAATIGPKGAAVEQVTQGTEPQAISVASFDGLGAGFKGPQGTSTGRNPSDNSLAVGRDEIVQIVNSRMAIFTKKGKKYAETGKALFGPAVTNTRAMIAPSGMSVITTRRARKTIPRGSARIACRAAPQSTNFWVSSDEAN